jgi:hypothetical protein
MRSVNTCMVQSQVYLSVVLLMGFTLFGTHVVRMAECTSTEQRSILKACQLTAHPDKVVTTAGRNVSPCEKPCNLGCCCGLGEVHVVIMLIWMMMTMTRLGSRDCLCASIISGCHCLSWSTVLSFHNPKLVIYLSLSDVSAE